jgi:signal transduction histidine kinase
MTRPSTGATRASLLLPRNWTIRVRLTVVYGGLFFLAGAVMLLATYLLVKQSLDARGVRITPPAAMERIPEVIRARFDPEALARVLEDIERDQRQFRSDTLNAVLTRGSLALGFVGVVAVAFGWLVADRVLRPLHQITETAGRIAGAGPAGRGLHERLALAGPRDEITKLADTFDSMLERLDRSFDGQRRFVANASHELRTPLAINRALIELAVSRPDAPDEVRRLGDALLAINARHERLIDGLLTLADSENAIGERSRMDLADVAGHVTREAGAAATEAEVEISTDLAAAPTTGDPILLERLVQNLVENAVRHNASGGRVWVGTGARGDVAELTVANTGPVIPPYEVETIFQPFRRLSGERASPDRGFGLGLSIVAAVAQAHGGRVTAAPREGGGLTVTVALPTAGEEVTQ